MTVGQLSSVVKVARRRVCSRRVAGSFLPAPGASTGQCPATVRRNRPARPAAPNGPDEQSPLLVRRARPVASPCDQYAATRLRAPPANSRPARSLLGTALAATAPRTTITTYSRAETASRVLRRRSGILGWHRWRTLRCVGTRCRVVCRFFGPDALAEQELLPVEIRVVIFGE
jgi:hypothetical protein